ncbi:MAG: hypothetical protein LUC49_01315 [Prevotella sp.]|nr:hypothetical protein [Prevotella sp.]
MGIEDLYVTANAPRNAPDYDTVVLGALLHTVEAFARVTYQSVYLIDYYKHEFLYISDNPLFLCGHTAKEVKELGYEFYLRHIPEREYKMFARIGRFGPISFLKGSTTAINTNAPYRVIFI